jgi:chitinase
MRTSILLSALGASFVAAAPSASQPLPPTLSVPGNGSSSTSFISAAWYPGWDATNTSLSTINWEKYSIIFWSFAVTTGDPSVLSLADSGEPFVTPFVEMAQQHGTMASMTVGGWTGSGHFSSAVSPQNRSTFVKAVLNLASQYKLDGLDFDWEYPNQLGIGCNEVSGSDAANFLALLQDIRKDPAGQNLYLSAAVSTTPFAGPDGKPITDVSQFASVLNHLTIMNYDTNGQWSTGVGPNAPLDDSCSSFPTGSATKALKAWTDAGFPAEQIVLGVPAYGHSFNVTPANALNSSGNLASWPAFTKAPLTSTLDQCGNAEPEVDTLTFSDLITKGYLNDDGTPASGVKHLFDNCSQTPFLYDGTKQLMVSYDDPQSFAAKGDFIVANDLLGFSMWDITGDKNDVLVDAISKAAGVTHDC